MRDLIVQHWIVTTKKSCARTYSIRHDRSHLHWPSDGCTWTSDRDRIPDDSERQHLTVKQSEAWVVSNVPEHGNGMFRQFTAAADGHESAGNVIGNLRVFIYLEEPRFAADDRAENRRRAMQFWLHLDAYGLQISVVIQERGQRGTKNLATHFVD